MGEVERKAWSQGVGGGIVRMGGTGGRSHCGGTMGVRVLGLKWRARLTYINGMAKGQAWTLIKTQTQVSTQNIFFFRQ